MCFQKLVEKKKTPTCQPTLTCFDAAGVEFLFVFPNMVSTPIRTFILNLFFYQCVSVCRRRRSGQNDGAEDEGGGGEEEDKRNRGEDVFGGNQRTGLRSCSSSPLMNWALLCLQSHDSKLCTETQVMKMGEKLQGLQEEKHQLFLQLKKVLHEEEKRRRKEQRCCNGY